MKGIVSFFPHFVPHQVLQSMKCIVSLLTHLVDIAESRKPFWCIWRESFNETGTCHKKGWGHVRTSKNEAPWSTKVSLVCPCWEEKFWCLWLVILLAVNLYHILPFITLSGISSLTGPWKKKCLAEFGIVTQCVAPTRVNDQYLTNVLLKINAKVCLFLSWDLESRTNTCIDAN